MGSIKKSDSMDAEEWTELKRQTQTSKYASVVNQWAKTTFYMLNYAHIGNYKSVKC